LEGISTVLLISPPNFRRFNEVIVPFLEKAKDHGVKHIVLSTVFAADGDPSGTFYKAEQVVKQSGLDYTIVRPNFIFENFINIDAQSIRDGSIYLPTGDTKTSYISVEDVAEVYRAVLTHPESHKNKAYNITGNEALNHSEMASIFSEVLKHKVVNINPFSEAYKQTLADAGLPEEIIKFLLYLYGAIKAGYFSNVTDEFRTLVGRTPTAFKDFVEKNKAVFEQQE